MNSRDAIITALTPGSPFNPKGLTFRSMKCLAAFATDASGEEVDTGEILEILNGDLVGEVTIKASTKGKGVLAALKKTLEQIEEMENAANPVLVAGGPAHNPPPAAPVLLQEDDPFDDDDDDEED